MSFRRSFPPYPVRSSKTHSSEPITISKAPWQSWYRISRRRDQAHLRLGGSAHLGLLCSGLDQEAVSRVGISRHEKATLRKVGDRSVVITVPVWAPGVPEVKVRECVGISWLASVVERTVVSGKTTPLEPCSLLIRTSHDLDRALCRFWLRGHCAKGPNCE